MSDISFKFDTLTLLLIVIYLAWPGLVLGAIIGALAWRRHWIWGGLIGAVLGLALWFGGWWAMRMRTMSNFRELRSLP